MTLTVGNNNVKVTILAGIAEIYGWIVALMLNSQVIYAGRIYPTMVKYLIPESNKLKAARYFILSDILRLPILFRSNKSPGRF